MEPATMEQLKRMGEDVIGAAMRLKSAIVAMDDKAKYAPQTGDSRDYIRGLATACKRGNAPMVNPSIRFDIMEPAEYLTERMRESPKKHIREIINAPLPNLKDDAMPSPQTATLKPEEIRVTDHTLYFKKPSEDLTNAAVIQAAWGLIRAINRNNEVNEEINDAKEVLRLLLLAVKQ